MKTRPCLTERLLMGRIKSNKEYKKMIEQMTKVVTGGEKGLMEDSLVCFSGEDTVFSDRNCKKQRGFQRQTKTEVLMTEGFYW